MINEDFTISTTDFESLIKYFTCLRDFPLDFQYNLIDNKLIKSISTNIAETYTCCTIIGQQYTYNIEFNYVEGISKYYMDKEDNIIRISLPLFNYDIRLMRYFVSSIINNHEQKEETTK